MTPKMSTTGFSDIITSALNRLWGPMGTAPPLALPAAEPSVDHNDDLQMVEDMFAALAENKGESVDLKAIGEIGCKLVERARESKRNAALYADLLEKMRAAQMTNWSPPIGTGSVAGQALPVFTQLYTSYDPVGTSISGGTSTSVTTSVTAPYPGAIQVEEWKK